MPILLALLPILGSALAGESAGAILAGISITQWIGISTALVGAAPEVLDLVSDLHEVFEALVNEIRASGDERKAANAATSKLAEWRNRPMLTPFNPSTPR